MRVVLGFDTSCYTTSAAAVNDRGEVVAFSRMLLPVAQGERGLRQSEAVFAHVRQMPLVMDGLREQLKEKQAQIAAVCASSAPRDEADSYMPVFTVGLGHARVLADALDVPLYQTSHQQGHIAAGRIGTGMPDGPFVALHLSGGTTELLSCNAGHLTLLGGSADLHAGQFVDRVGVAMGLPFPAGPSLEELALACSEPAEAVFPVSFEKGDLLCHLSGVETKAQQLLQTEAYSHERLALELYDVLSRTVARLLTAGCKQAGCSTALVVGGVASSSLLRSLLQKRFSRQRFPVRIFFGKPEYSADNAAGVAAIGMREYLATQPLVTKGECPDACANS